MCTLVPDAANRVFNLGSADVECTGLKEIGLRRLRFDRFRFLFPQEKVNFNSFSTINHGTPLGLISHSPRLAGIGCNSSAMPVNMRSEFLFRI